MPVDQKKISTAQFDIQTLGEVLKAIDPSITPEALAGIVKSAGGDSAAIQSLFGQLNKLLLGGPSTVEASELQTVIDNISAARVTGKVINLAGADSTKIAAMANSEISVRYALLQGLPFAITGNPGIYDSLNRDGSLFKFDPNTGEKNTTDEWFKDRAQFLAVKFNAAGESTLSVSGTQSWTFEERTDNGVSRIQVNADQGQRAAAKMIFATATTQTQTIVGSASGDHIYSGGGDDQISAGAGDDYVEGGGGGDMIDGGRGNDTLLGGLGDDQLEGGAGDDTIASGSGNDLFAFNALDGDDHIRLGGGEDTLSLGGGIRYEDLSLMKQGDSLRLNLGNGDMITFDDWYTSPANQSLVNLQVIADSLGDYNASGSNVLKDNRVESFDFLALVGKFEEARAANPRLNKWSMMNSMLGAHLGGSDVAAMGGDLAYQYGHAGSLANVSVDAAQAMLASAQLNVDPQALQSVAALQLGNQRLM